MTESTLIDEVVQRVLSELGTRGRAAPPVNPVAAARPEPRLDAAVVTQEVLAHGLGSSGRVRVAPRAVITPAARDFARERGIEIVRDAPLAERPGPKVCQILVTTANGAATAALETLRATGIVAGHRLLGPAAEAAAQGVSALSRGETPLVLVLSDEPELVACLANRNERVRAASLRGGSAWESVRKSLVPNLIAIDPSRDSSFELVRLVKAILNSALS